MGDLVVCLEYFDVGYVFGWGFVYCGWKFFDEVGMWGFY